jgi:hypothetical protein
LHKVGVDQGTQDLRCFEKHVQVGDNQMGFEDYKPDLAFVHKEDIDGSLEGEEIVVELEDCVPLRTVDFLEKGCSTDWVWWTHFSHTIDGKLQIEAGPQHEGALQMEVVLWWEDAPQLEVEFPKFEN